MFLPRSLHLCTGLNLYLEQTGETEYSVTLEGDAIREEYLGPDPQLATDLYDTIEAMYENREKQETKESLAQYKQYPMRAVQVWISGD